MVPETNVQPKAGRSLSSMAQHVKEGAMLYVRQENTWLHLQLLFLTAGFILNQLCKQMTDKIR